MKLTFHWRPLKSAIRDAWPVGLLVAGAVLASLIAWLVSTTLSDAVRYAGMMLQIGGLATVAFGLGQTRRMFNLPSVHALLLSWSQNLSKPMQYQFGKA